MDNKENKKITMHQAKAIEKSGALTEGDGAHADRKVGI